MIKKSKWLFCCIILVITFSIGYSKVVSANGSVAPSTESQKILITCAGSKDIQVDVEEIKNLPSVQQEVVSVNSNGDKSTYTVKAGDFDNLLKKLNITKDSIGGLRFYCSDGYSVEVPENIIKTRHILLSYLKNGQDLGDDGPIMIVIPDERAMYWAKKVTKIEIIKNTKKIDITGLDFIEAIGKSKIINSYKDYEGKNKAIKCSDLIKLINTKNKPDFVIIKAADKLEKNETLANFNKAYIKLTGKNAPEFTSQTMLAGMSVKGLLWFSYGEVACFSMTKGIGALNLINIGDKRGISLDNVFKLVSMKNASSYVMTARNGKKITIDGDNIKKAVVYKNKQEQVVIEIPSGVKNIKLEDVISVKVK